MRVTVGIEQSDYDQLSRIAGSAGVSLAWMMRRAAREFIERVEMESTNPIVLGLSTRNK